MYIYIYMSLGFNSSVGLCVMSVLEVVVLEFSWEGRVYLYVLYASLLPYPLWLKLLRGFCSHTLRAAVRTEILAS
jgi:hypothetical protein